MRLDGRLRVTLSSLVLLLTAVLGQDILLLGPALLGAWSHKQCVYLVVQYNLTISVDCEGWGTDSAGVGASCDPCCTPFCALPSSGSPALPWPWWCYNRKRAFHYFKVKSSFVPCDADKWLAPPTPHQVPLQQPLLQMSLPTLPGWCLQQNHNIIIFHSIFFFHL